MSDASNADNMGIGAQNPAGDDMDRYLTNKASAFKYPATPDIATGVRTRLADESMHRAGDKAGRIQPQSRPRLRPRPAWTSVALALVVVLGISLTVPQVRSFIGNIYTGIVHAFKPEPGPLPVPNVPVATPTPVWDTNLYGKTDFGSAQQMMLCALKVPMYPAGLGLPDNVFYQTSSGGDTVIMVWMDPDHPDKPRIALYVMTQQSLAFSIVNNNPNQVKTKVNQDQAHWVTGTISIDIYDSSGNKKLASSRVVNGPVLVWTESMSNGTDCKTLTYRLETSLPMDEAVKIAESLGVPNQIPTPVPTNTPGPTTTPVSPATALLSLAGETGLLGLSADAGFPVKIPVVADQPDLVSPGRIYLQDLGSKTVIMAWYVGNRTDDISMVLYQIQGTDRFAARTASSTTVLQQTSVHGNPAQWVQGPHTVYVNDGQSGVSLQPRTFINGGHSLVWQEGGITYRLETGGTLEDALKIAESLK